VDDASNTVIFHKAVGQNEFIPHAVYMSEPKPEDNASATELKETRDDRSHHLVLQLPGIPRNQIKVMVRDSVLSLTANIPTGLEHLAPSHEGFRMVGNSTLVTGTLHLDFPLPKGSVQEVDDMFFLPGAMDYRGLLTVSIPTHKGEGFIPDDLEELQERKKREAEKKMFGV